jgi:hypothetical protein
VGKIRIIGEHGRRCNHEWARQEVRKSKCALEEEKCEKYIHNIKEKCLIHLKNGKYKSCNS